MNPSIEPLYVIYNLNRRLFLNTLTDIDDDLARKRPNNKTNSMIFIACHLLDARYYIGKLIGLYCECPFKDIFDQTNSIEDFTEFPKLADISSSWHDISNKILMRLKTIHKSDLADKAPFDVPVEDNTVFGLITFLAQHESYHIGQLALLRKYFGLKAMRYNE